MNTTKFILGAVILAAISFFFHWVPVDQTYIAASGAGKSIQWFSVMPPLVVVVLAFVTGKIIVSLFFGVLFGALLSAGGNPLDMVVIAGKNYIFEAMRDDFHIWTVVFIVTLVGMISVVSRIGGTQGIIDVLAKKATTSRAASLITAVMGLVIFFDDYANTILVGTSARPLTDKYKISREKLAYIVDSTAAPVAGLAVLSTWIGYEVGLFQTVLTSLNINVSGYEAFFYALPFRFYCMFALIFVFMNIFSKREFGGMLTAQKRALHEGKVFSDDAEVKTSLDFERTRPHENAVPHWRNAVIPIGTVILVIWVGLYYSGAVALKRQLAFGDLFNFTVLRQCFSEANNIVVLASGGIIGSVVALLMAVGQKILSIKEATVTYLVSFRSIIAPLCILILAWSIQNACGDLGTSIYLTATLKDVMNPMFLPVAIFMLAGLIAFSTGTSWGTMAILIPTAIPLTYQLGGLELTYISMAAVLDGAIFGDHCSPVSDTTLMSSIASGCDHMHHVKTQIPYALTCMFVALICGYTFSALGASWIIAFGSGLVAMMAVLFIVGKKVEA